MRRLFLNTIMVLLFGWVTIGCTEPYALQTSAFEDALVIEATLTNEMKTQKIKLSRTYRFEENGPTFESGANVSILDDLGNAYTFEENFDSYTSVDPFQAEPGRTYTLHINTSNGKSYSSTAETLTTVNNMQDVVASVETVNGVRGVQINVKSFDPSGSSKYYRYDYEETYKIIAPRWSMFRAITVPGEPHESIEIIPRPAGETKTCYKTEMSNDILQTTTSNLAEDRVDYTVRFISDQNPIISHRYSILVRQYVQSLAAYTFYKTLKELSGNGSILSQNQPGFFYGNVRCNDNPTEKVVGFFEVASASTQRIFFNYSDLFPGEQLPPYFVDCDVQTFKFCFVSTDPECKGGALLSFIHSNQMLYYSESDSVYAMVLPPCGDCTTISSNVIPSFWED